MNHILTNSSSLTTIREIHAYKSYLQVTFLSDITTVKGDKLLTTSLQEIREKKASSATTECIFLKTLEDNAYNISLFFL